MLTTPEKRIQWYDACDPPLRPAREYIRALVTDLDETLDRAEEAEAMLGDSKDELDRMDANLKEADQESDTLKAALRFVREMLVQLQCYLPVAPNQARICDGDDCIRCATLIQIDRALGEEVAHG